MSRGPKDRYAETKVRTRGASAYFENAAIAGILGGTQARKHTNVEQQRVVRALADHPLCHPNYRACLLEVYLTHLQSRDDITLSDNAIRRTYEWLKLANAVTSGRLQLKRADGCVGPTHTVEQSKAYFKQKVDARLARQPDWARDKSKLPMKPPPRKIADE